MKKEKKINWLFVASIVFFVIIIMLCIFLFKSPANILNLSSNGYKDNMIFISVGERGYLLLEVHNNEKITLSPIVSMVDKKQYKCIESGWCVLNDDSCIKLENTQLEEIPPRKTQSYFLTIKIKNESRCEDGQSYPVKITIRDINGGDYWDTRDYNIVIPINGNTRGK